MEPQEITEELEHPGARKLLDSATLLRLAYNRSDGFLRVIPIGFRKSQGAATSGGARPLYVLLCFVAALGAGAPQGLAARVTSPDIARAELLRIARVTAPPTGVGLLINVDFARGQPYLLDGTRVTALTAAITPQGRTTLVGFVPAQAQPGSSRNGLPECLDPLFEAQGPSWSAADLPLRWRFRESSTPPPLTRHAARRSLRAAHATWSRLAGTCRASQRGFAFSYSGPTRRTVGQDGRNIVEFGPVGASAVAVNYLWYRGTRALETDLRFKRQRNIWTTAPRNGARFQLLNVATHELGHQVGLADLAHPHDQLTMFGSTERGELKKATLGWGDVEGAKLVAP